MELCQNQELPATHVGPLSKLPLNPKEATEWTPKTMVRDLGSQIQMPP